VGDTQSRRIVPVFIEDKNYALMYNNFADFYGIAGVDIFGTGL